KYCEPKASFEASYRFPRPRAIRLGRDPPAAGLRSLRPLLRPEKQRQPGLAAAHHDDLRVRRRGELLGGLDALPLEELLADPLRDDLLEIGDALRLYTLALGFLLLLGQHVLHLHRFLLGALLGFDRRLQRFGELDLAQQHVLDDDAAIGEVLAELVEDALGDELAPARVERGGGIRRGGI